MSSRQALVAAAQQLFAEKGYSGTTVKDLADHAGVNVSLVSYHFGGKEGLYRSCLEAFANQNTAAAARILEPAENETEFRVRLYMFAEHMVSLSDSEPHVCKIVHRDFEFLEDPKSEVAQIAAQVFERSFLPLYHLLEKFLLAAQKSKILRSDVPGPIATTLVFGGLMQMVRMEEKRRRYLGQELLASKVRTETLKTYVDIFLKGLGN